MLSVFWKARPKPQGIALGQLAVKLGRLRANNVACPAGRCDLHAATHLNLQTEFDLLSLARHKLWASNAL
jgi:hypothetical protein